MEVYVDSTGNRIFINSPAVDQANQKRNVILYDPNGYNLDTGLYDRPQPSCERWIDHFHQYQKKHPVPPLYSVDQDGNTHYAPRRKGPRVAYNR